MLHNPTMAKKTELEEWQKADAWRLRSRFTEHLKNTGLTQEKFMAQCGYTQGMVAQYIGTDNKDPSRALNIEIAITLAKHMGITVDDFSPTLANQVREMVKYVDHQETETPASAKQ